MFGMDCCHGAKVTRLGLDVALEPGDMFGVECCHAAKVTGLV